MRAFHRAVQRADLLRLPRVILVQSRASSRQDGALRLESLRLLRQLVILVHHPDELRLPSHPPTLQFLALLLRRLRLARHVLDRRLHRTRGIVLPRARRLTVVLAIESLHLRRPLVDVVVTPRNLNLVLLDGATLLRELGVQLRQRLLELCVPGANVQRVHARFGDVVLQVRRLRLRRANRSSRLARRLRRLVHPLLHRRLLRQVGQHAFVLVPHLHVTARRLLLRDFGLLIETKGRFPRGVEVRLRLLQRRGHLRVRLRQPFLLLATPRRVLLQKVALRLHLSQNARELFVLGGLFLHPAPRRARLRVEHRRLLLLRVERVARRSKRVFAFGSADQRALPLTRQLRLLVVHRLHLCVRLRQRLSRDGRLASLRRRLRVERRRLEVPFF